MGTAIMCRQCGDVIRSFYRHDFKPCSCGAIYIDGGEDYFRTGGDINDILHPWTGLPYFDIEKTHNTVVELRALLNKERRDHAEAIGELLDSR